jgi:CRISPR system Cascade subunit CasA
LADAICLRGVSLFLSGDSLFETLLMNLVTGQRESDDLPAWERDDPMTMMDEVVSGKRKSRPALGVADRYAWTSRMIRLLPESDGFVRRAYFTQGREADKSADDPMKLFVEDQKIGAYPFNLNAGKATWRDLHAFLKPKSHAPNRILEHAATLIENDFVPEGMWYRLNVVGLATDPGKAGKFLLWRHDRMSLPAALLADADMIEAVREAIDAAETIARQINSRIRKMAWRFLPPDGNPDPKDVDKLSQALDARPGYWARLEPRFHGFLHALNGDMDQASADWRANVEREAKTAMQEAVKLLGVSVRAIRAVATISDYFIASREEINRLKESGGKKKGEQAA